mgnify:CR=1 FL=1
MPLGEGAIGTEPLGGMIQTRRTSALGDQEVTIELGWDDTLNVMRSVTVNNRGTKSVKIVLGNGKEFIVSAGLLLALPLLSTDELTIDAKSNGDRRGRPYAVAYPWT